MRRWAEFILRHRRWVIAFWGLVIIAGIAAAGTVSDRMTVDFSLPGQPGSEAAQARSSSVLGNGGDTSPYRRHRHHAAGPDQVTGNEAEVAKAFAAIAGETTDAASGRRGEHRRQARSARPGRPHRVRAGVLPVPTVHPRRRCRPTAIRAAAEAAEPAGASVGVTGEDALAVGDEGNGGPGVLGETLLGALGALAVLAFVFASFLAFLPLVVAAVSILATFLCCCR